jgi:hypothetical protein
MQKVLTLQWKQDMMKKRKKESHISKKLQKTHFGQKKPHKKLLGGRHISAGRLYLKL